MKKFLGYLRDFIRQDFHWPTYLAIAVYLTAYTIFNYNTKFETGLITKYYYSNWLIPVLFVYYWANYLLPCFIYSLFRREWDYWRKPMFWVIGITATFLLAFDTGFIFHNEWLRDHAPLPLRYWLRKIIYNAASVVTHLLPLYLFYKFVDRKTENFYGLTTKNVEWRPYLMMLGIMAVLVTVASFHPSFYKFYPLYKHRGEAVYLEVPQLITGLAYEIAYGWDFITVEHMLRGFLVIGMSQAMGRRAVLPMAALYCTYHFGKPAGEAISSIFGGYILGVIALYSRNVWGGVFVHMGTAWLMELAAALQNYFRS